MSFYKDEQSSTWRVIISEPDGKKSLGESRKITWKIYLEKALGRNMPENRFFVETTDSNESSVSIVFPGARPPLTDLALRGEAKSSLKMTIEEMSSLIKIKEEKDLIIVDLRHDRLFLPGSAYIRDEALPYLTAAMNQVREAMGGKVGQTLSIKAPDEKSKVERDTNEGQMTKKILLQSFTQKLPDNQKDKEEDPKLTVTRSKVLFMLFAREGLTP